MDVVQRLMVGLVNLHGGIRWNPDLAPMKIQQIAPYIPYGVIQENIKLASEVSKFEWTFAVPGIYVEGAIHHVRIFNTSPGRWSLEVGDVTFDLSYQTPFHQNAIQWQKDNIKGLYNQAWLKEKDAIRNSLLCLRDGKITPVASVLSLYPKHDKVGQRALIVHSENTILTAECRLSPAYISSGWCARCGRAIQPYGCQPCGFKHDILYMTNLMTGGDPIDEEAQLLVESNGWSFVENPVIARAEESARSPVPL